MDFVCGAFVCAVVCASPAPRRRATRTSPLQGTCHHPTTTSAAGELARCRRRAPQEPPLLRAPKSLRAPPSWAHFSVAFSQAGDLGFPIFTEPAFPCVKVCAVDYQFGVHLSHKITPLPPIENFSTVIGLSIVLSPPARRRLPTRSAALWPSLAAYILPQRA